MNKGVGMPHADVAALLQDGHSDVQKFHPAPHLTDVLALVCLFALPSVASENPRIQPG
jgi:hypothetical protein